jgi:uncharacterized protein YdeI (YjbR/CyaY-like superfamily)
MASYLDELERIYPKNREEWHQWLKDNHETSPGVWVIYYKKNSSKPRVEYDEAVEEALSFGWIDSKVNALDQERYMQVFTPRKPGSIWSKHNKRRVHKLTNEGRMQTAGRDKVERAKQDGSWSFLDDIEAMIIPEDLKGELEKNKKAHENFNQFPDSIKKQILYWIATAKRETTRKKRIKLTVESAGQNEKPV